MGLSSWAVTFSFVRAITWDQVWFAGRQDAEPHLLLSPLVLARLSGAAALAVRFAGKEAEGLGAKRRQRERSSTVAERKRDGRRPVTPDGELSRRGHSDCGRGLYRKMSR